MAFLTAALQRVKSDKFTGAVIIAVHHPPFTGGSDHGGSPLMLADIDSACTAAGVWPHAVFSGHSHNYQRYTRTVNGMPIPYIVAGCGGHSPLSTMRSTIPDAVQDRPHADAGELRQNGLRIFARHGECDDDADRVSSAERGGTTKTPDDSVTSYAGESYSELIAVPVCSRFSAYARRASLDA